MFFAVNKNDDFQEYSGKDLKIVYENMLGNGEDVTTFDFYKGTKIEVREIPSRLEIVPEVKKPAPVRKPVAKSKK